MAELEQFIYFIASFLLGGNYAISVYLVKKKKYQKRMELTKLDGFRAVGFTKSEM